MSERSAGARRARRLRVIPEPEPNTRSVIFRSGEGTVAFSGEDASQPTWVCGNCGAPLIETLPIGQIENIVIRCNNCGSFNEVAPQRDPGELYPRAPIVEALCDIRSTPTGRWDGTEFGRIYDRVRERYPKREPLTEMGPLLVSTPGMTPGSLPGSQVLRLSEEDDSAFLLIRANGISIHQRAPYPGWIAFRTRIAEALPSYREIVESASIQRLGLRYNNRIALHEENVDLVQNQATFSGMVRWSA